MRESTEEKFHNVVPEYGGVVDLIAKRRSPRAFSQQSISSTGLQVLFEAASLAASSMNEQPWRYVYAHRNDPEFQDFVACLNQTNAIWAQNAAVLMLSFASLVHRRNDAPNRFALHDAGSANTTLLLQAASMDIYGHMMGGFAREKTIETFGLGPEYEPVCFIALGYLGDPDTLEEKLRTREMGPRRRIPIDSFVHKGRIE